MYLSRKKISKLLNTNNQSNKRFKKRESNKKAGRTFRNKRRDVNLRKMSLKLRRSKNKKKVTDYYDNSSSDDEDIKGGAGPDAGPGAGPDAGPGAGSDAGPETDDANKNVETISMDLKLRDEKKQREEKEQRLDNEDKLDFADVYKYEITANSGKKLDEQIKKLEARVKAINKANEEAIQRRTIIEAVVKVLIASKRELTESSSKSITGKKKTDKNKKMDINDEINNMTKIKKDIDKVIKKYETIKQSYKNDLESINKYRERSIYYEYTEPKSRITFYASSVEDFEKDYDERRAVKLIFPVYSSEPFYIEKEFVGNDLINKIKDNIKYETGFIFKKKTNIPKEIMKMINDYNVKSGELIEEDTKLDAAVDSISSETDEKSAENIYEDKRREDVDTTEMDRVREERQISEDSETARDEAVQQRNATRDTGAKGGGGNTTGIGWGGTPTVVSTLTRKGEELIYPIILKLYSANNKQESDEEKREKLARAAEARANADATNLVQKAIEGQTNETRKIEQAKSKEELDNVIKTNQEESVVSLAELELYLEEAGIDSDKESDKIKLELLEKLKKLKEEIKKKNRQMIKDKINELKKENSNNTQDNKGLGGANPNPKTNTSGVISGTGLTAVQLGAVDTESSAAIAETEAKSKLEVAQQQQDLAKDIQLFKKFDPERKLLYYTNKNALLSKIIQLASNGLSIMEQKKGKEFKVTEKKNIEPLKKLIGEYKKLVEKVEDTNISIDADELLSIDKSLEEQFGDNINELLQNLQRMDSEIKNNEKESFIKGGASTSSRTRGEVASSGGSISKALGTATSIAATATGLTAGVVAGNVPLGVVSAAGLVASPFYLFTKSQIVEDYYGGPIELRSSFYISAASKINESVGDFFKTAYKFGPNGKPLNTDILKMSGDSTDTMIKYLNFVSGKNKSSDVDSNINNLFGGGSWRTSRDLMKKEETLNTSDGLGIMQGLSLGRTDTAGDRKVKVKRKMESKYFNELKSKAKIKIDDSLLKNLNKINLKKYEKLFDEFANLIEDKFENKRRELIDGIIETRKLYETSKKNFSQSSLKASLDEFDFDKLTDIFNNPQDKEKITVDYDTKIAKYRSDMNLKYANEVLPLIIKMRGLLQIAQTYSGVCNELDEKFMKVEAFQNELNSYYDWFRRNSTSVKAARIMIGAFAISLILTPIPGFNPILTMLMTEVGTGIYELITDFSPDNVDAGQDYVTAEERGLPTKGLPGFEEGARDFGEFIEPVLQPFDLKTSIPKAAPVAAAAAVDKDPIYNKPFPMDNDQDKNSSLQIDGGGLGNRLGLYKDKATNDTFIETLLNHIIGKDLLGFSPLQLRKTSQFYIKKPKINIELYMYPYKIYYTLKLYNKYKAEAEAEADVGTSAEKAKKNYIQKQSEYYYNQLMQILMDNIQDLITNINTQVDNVKDANIESIYISALDLIRESDSPAGGAAEAKEEEEEEKDRGLDPSAQQGVQQEDHAPAQAPAQAQAQGMERTNAKKLNLKSGIDNAGENKKKIKIELIKLILGYFLIKFKNPDPPANPEGAPPANPEGAPPADLTPDQFIGSLFEGNGFKPEKLINQLTNLKNQEFDKIFNLNQNIFSSDHILSFIPDDPKERVEIPDISDDVSEAKQVKEAAAEQGNKIKQEQQDKENLKKELENKIQEGIDNSDSIALQSAISKAKRINSNDDDINLTQTIADAEALLEKIKESEIFQREETKQARDANVNIAQAEAAAAEAKALQNQKFGGSRIKLNKTRKNRRRINHGKTQKGGRSLSQKYLRREKRKIFRSQLNPFNRITRNIPNISSPFSQLANNIKYNGSLMSIDLDTKCRKINGHIRRLNNRILILTKYRNNISMNNTPSFFDRLNKNSISNMKKIIKNDTVAEKIMEIKINKVKRQIDLKRVRGELSELKRTLKVNKSISKQLPKERGENTAFRLPKSKASNSTIRVGNKNFVLSDDNQPIKNAAINREVANTGANIVANTGANTGANTVANTVANTGANRGGSGVSSDSSLTEDINKNGKNYNEVIILKRGDGYKLILMIDKDSEPNIISISDDIGRQLSKLSKEKVNQYELPFKKAVANVKDELAKIKKTLSFNLEKEVLKLSTENSKVFMKEVLELISKMRDDLDKKMKGGASPDDDEENDDTDDTDDMEPDDDNEVNDENLVDDILSVFNYSLISAYALNSSQAEVSAVNNTISNMINVLESEIKPLEEEEKKLTAAQEEVEKLDEQMRELEQSASGKFSIALAYRELRDRYTKTEKEYKENLEKIKNKKKELKKQQRKLFGLKESREKIKTLKNEINDLEDETIVILQSCFECILDDKKREEYKEMQNMPEKEKYMTKIRDKSKLMSSMGIRSKKKVYDIGLKNIYEYHDAFTNFRRTMGRDEFGYITDGVNEIESDLYKRGLPFFYEDKIRIALKEDNQEELKKVVAFLQRTILNNSNLDESNRDDIGPIFIKQKLYNQESNLSKQYDIARRIVGKLKDEEYDAIEKEYNNDIDFGFLVATKKAMKLREETGSKGLQDRFIFNKSDWEKSTTSEKVKINIDNLNKIVANILDRSKKKIQNDSNKIYDKDHMEYSKVLLGTNMWFFMKYDAEEREKDLLKLRKIKDDIFQASFNVVKIIEYYRNSGYVELLKKEVANEYVMWGRKNVSIYNLLRNEHTRIINQLKTYGVRQGMGNDFIKKYTATIQQKANLAARRRRLFSAKKSENIIYDSYSMGGHRPMINDKTLKEKYGRMDIMTRQPLYDINADRLLNIEKYLGVYSDKLPSTKKREIELSKYGELVNAYRELAVSDNDKDPWSGLAETDRFEYIQLPMEIKLLIEFWRRNYGEENAVELDDDNIEEGLEIRKAVWVKNNESNCNDLLKWEYNTFGQFISENGKICLEKQSNKRLASIEKDGCDNFNILFNSTGLKTYKSLLPRLTKYVDKCASENKYNLVDGSTSPDGTQLDKDISVDEDETAVKVTSRDLGTQGELTFRILFDKSKASADMVGDLGSDNTYYWQNFSDVMKQLKSTTPLAESNIKIKTDEPSEVAQGTTTEKKSDEDADKSKVDEDAAKSKAEEDAGKTNTDEDAAKTKAGEESDETKAEEETDETKGSEESDETKTDEESAKTKTDEESDETKADEDAAKLKADEDAAKLKADEDAAKLKAENDKKISDLQEQLKKQNITKEEKNKLQKELENVNKEKIDLSKKLEDTGSENKNLASENSELQIKLDEEKAKAMAELQEKAKAIAELEELKLKDAKSNEERDALQKSLDEAKKLQSDAQEEIKKAEEEKKKTEELLEKERQLKTASEEDKQKLQDEIDNKKKELEDKRAEMEASQKELQDKLEKVEADKNAVEQEVAKRKTFTGRFMRGGSKKRKYSFKKLPKRKRRNNKSNKTQAKKRGKRLNRTKKMSR